MIGIQSQSLTPRALKDAPVINTEKIEPGSERRRRSEVNPRRKNEHPRPPSVRVAPEFVRKTRTADRGLNRRRGPPSDFDEEMIKSRGEIKLIKSL